MRGMQSGLASLRDRAAACMAAPDTAASVAAAGAAPDAAAAAATRRRALYAAGARVKYLVDAPEKVPVPRPYWISRTLLKSLLNFK